MMAYMIEVFNQASATWGAIAECADLEWAKKLAGYYAGVQRQIHHEDDLVGGSGMDWNIITKTDAIPVSRVVEKLLSSAPAAAPVDFRKGLENLINLHSLENGSDTPDFILGDYLRHCLEALRVEG